jgi:glycine betaine/choline ABC-type transport system substrate-binding protein
LSALRSLVVAGAVALATASTGFGAGAQLTLADTGTTASRLRADLSAQALTAQGFTVTRTTLSSATAAEAALTAGTIDAYATETATLLERVLARPKLRDDAQLRGALTSRLTARAQVPLAIDPADDAPQVACRKTVVRAHKLTGLLTLGRAAGNLTYAATAAHVVRGDGLAALHVRFRRVIVTSGTKRFDLIARRKVHCVLSSGAEPRAARLNLVALRDLTRRLAGTPQHGLIVASQTYLGTAPATFTPTLDRVAALVTTGNLRSLIGQVELDGQDSVVAAQTLLRANRIIP